MARLSNQLPAPGPEFPADWGEEFKHELARSGLRRAGMVTVTLLVIEAILLLSDFYRTQGFTTVDALLLWRLVAVAFLLSYRYLIGKTLPEQFRLRYFLLMGMVLCCWVSAVLAGISGDMSTFTIGALGVAAACPLPGRFNASLFTAAGLVLIGWLYTHFPQVGPYLTVPISPETFHAAIRSPS